MTYGADFWALAFLAAMWLTVVVWLLVHYARRAHAASQEVLGEATEESR